MTSKTTNKFWPEVGARAVRMVVDHEREHPSRWTTIVSIARKIRLSSSLFPMCYGPELVARALLKWMTDQGIETALIDAGKPWPNGVSKSFIGKFRDECLSMEWLLSRAPGQGRD